MTVKRTYDEEFEHFWANYPYRIGKLKAEKAYAKARHKASADELIEGIRRYVQHKPDWQAYAHPATWLHAGRWMDEAPVKAASEFYEPWVCPHKDRCAHRRMCEIRIQLAS